MCKNVYVILGTPVIDAEQFTTEIEREPFIYSVCKTVKKAEKERERAEKEYKYHDFFICDEQILK